MSDPTLLPPLTLASVPAALVPGEMRLIAAGQNAQTLPALSLPLAELVPPRLPVGAVLGPDPAGDPLFQVLAVAWAPGTGSVSAVTPPGTAASSTPPHAAPGLWVQVLRPVSAQVEPLALSAWKRGRTLAWITLSDKGSQGLREDLSGPLMAELAGPRLGLCLSQGFILPDDVEEIKALLVDLALRQGFDCVLTSGGTGVGPRDVTPEATLAVIEKRLPGFERAMTALSLAKTPHAAISRAVAGALGRCLIVNMPGSRKAVAECLEAILPAMGHAVDKLQGDPADCGG